MHEPILSVKVTTYRLARFIVVEPTSDTATPMYYVQDDGVHIGVATAEDLGACLPW